MSKQVVIKTICGKSFDSTMEVDKTVEDLKKQIYVKIGAPSADRVCIFLDGDEVENNEKIYDDLVRTRTVLYACSLLKRKPGKKRERSTADWQSCLYAETEDCRGCACTRVVHHIPHQVDAEGDFYCEACWIAIISNNPDDPDIKKARFEYV